MDTTIITVTSYVSIGCLQEQNWLRRTSPPSTITIDLFARQPSSSPLPIYISQHPTSRVSSAYSCFVSPSPVDLVIAGTSATSQLAVTVSFLNFCTLLIDWLLTYPGNYSFLDDCGNDNDNNNCARGNIELRYSLWMFTRSHSYWCGGWDIDTGLSCFLRWKSRLLELSNGWKLCWNKHNKRSALSIQFLLLKPICLRLIVDIVRYMISGVHFQLIIRDVSRS